MAIDIPPETRILIIEGIAGSGKTTLRRQLKQQFEQRAIYEFTEEELLLSWKHIHMPHIAALRLQFMHRFLDYVEEKLHREWNDLLILERFHLSHKILEWEFENGFEREYDRLLSRLKKLPVLVLIAELSLSEIEERMYHRERSEQWNQFIEDKLALRGFDDLKRLSVDQQEQYLALVREQGIPFAAVHVELDF